MTAATLRDTHTVQQLIGKLTAYNLVCAEIQTSTNFVCGHQVSSGYGRTYPIFDFIYFDGAHVRPFRYTRFSAAFLQPPLSKPEAWTACRATLVAAAMK